MFHLVVKSAAGQVVVHKSMKSDLPAQASVREEKIWSLSAR
jgi:hypothetical protein